MCKLRQFMNQLTKADPHTLRSTIVDNYGLFALRPDILTVILQTLDWRRSVTVFGALIHTDVVLPEHHVEFTRALCYSPLWEIATEHWKKSTHDPERRDCLVMCLARAGRWQQAFAFGASSLDPSTFPALCVPPLMRAQQYREAFAHWISPFCNSHASEERVHDVVFHGSGQSLCHLHRGNISWMHACRLTALHIAAQNLPVGALSSLLHVLTLSSRWIEALKALDAFQASSSKVTLGHDRHLRALFTLYGSSQASREKSNELMVAIVRSAAATKGKDFAKGLVPVALHRLVDVGDWASAARLRCLL